MSTKRNARNSTARRLALLGVAGLTATGLAAATFAGPAQAATGHDLDARMKSTAAHPRAHGHAEYDVDRSGREFEITVQGIKGLAGHRLVVRVHGDLVGKMKVNRYGRAHLERENGVPRMVAGNVVKVRTLGGGLVSRGVLHRETDSDLTDVD